MTTPFPTQLSEIHFNDTTTTPNIYTTLKNLKRTTLSLHNRLRSILTDAENLTTTIHPRWPYPLIANERCGSWYIPPTQKSGSAYFKSTDGHYGSWAFSLRRLNLPVLEIMRASGGAVLVDSTRRGKRMPDALRRTVPIWTVVWNRVLFMGVPGFEGVQWEWAWRLQHPGLEDAEVRIVESRVDGWVLGLRGLELDLDAWRSKVVTPIRLRWVVAGEETTGLDGEGVGAAINEFVRSRTLVLVSASRPVLGAEMSEDGYIQGAADDAEGWSGGLTAKLFWAHREELMAAQEEDLPELLVRLIEADRPGSGRVDAVQITPTRNLFVAAASSGLAVGSGEFGLVVNCNKGQVSGPRMIELDCRSGKLGSRDLRDKLSTAVDHVMAALKKDANIKILVVCENGKDLSIGFLVSLLCLLYDDKGQLLVSISNVVDKQFVKKRLAWISTVKPDANPSRSTLQAVNSFLMERPS